MKMVEIPLQTLPNQEFSAVLGGQNCVVNIRQAGGFCYLSLTADGQRICAGHVCQSGEPIPVWNTPDFSGRLFFVDENGRFAAPEYSELGTRYRLFYATAEEWQQLTARKIYA